jgi:allophanate hydrolase subunit 1
MIVRKNKFGGRDRTKESTWIVLPVCFSELGEELTELMHAHGILGDKLILFLSWQTYTYMRACVPFLKNVFIIKKQLVEEFEFFSRLV